jgi:small subunit ribosomal protein S16
MVRIRLRRVGGHNQASFRIVATDKESPVKGRFIEVLGFYNPRTEPATITLEEERIYHWISKGAQPSDSVMQIFKLAGLTGRYERFKGGEKVEALLAEAGDAAKSRNVNVKTRRAAPAKSTRKKKDAEGAAAPAAAPGAEAAPAEEAPKAE